MSTLSRLKQSFAHIEKRIDDYAEFYPIVDYSFYDAEKLEAATSFQPRKASVGPKLIKKGNQYHSNGLNLNHNKLDDPMESLPNFIRERFIDPHALYVLDLSFNLFTQIPIAIQQLTSLKYLYFHKNFISNIKEVRKLSSLKQLKFLTLNANPIEDDVPYLRFYVLCVLPGLRNLNYTTISESDLKTSVIWENTNKNLSPTPPEKVPKRPY